MEKRINESLNIINDNISFYNTLDNAKKDDCNKELNDKFLKSYTKYVNKIMEEIKTEVDNYHTKNDLYKKYEKLDKLIHGSPELEHPVCQFYDDIDHSFNAMTVEYKRKLLECLKQNERNYDAAIDSLEKKVSSTKSEISNYIKKAIEQ